MYKETVNSSPGCTDFFDSLFDAVKTVMYVVHFFPASFLFDDGFKWRDMKFNSLPECLFCHKGGHLPYKTQASVISVKSWALVNVLWNVTELSLMIRPWVILFSSTSFQNMVHDWTSLSGKGFSVCPGQVHQLLSSSWSVHWCCEAT